MSDVTGNTTSPANASERLASAADTRVLAVVLCQYDREPRRVGEVALCDPQGRRPLLVGRLGNSFFQQRPGENINHGRLRGDTISGEQLLIAAEGGGARVHNVGRAPVLVDGTRLPKDRSALVRLGAVIEVVGHSVLLLTTRTLKLSPPHPLLLPLFPFGEIDPRGFAGESPRAWFLREAIVRAAERGLPVTIYGETGTGKELVARAIHAISRGPGTPFFAANCVELRGEVAALRLFGGRKGWPNPGTLETIGYFEVAANGVLFLDEIGEVDASIQNLLLRATEHGYTRVGETEPRPVRCVVVVATNRGEAGVKFDVEMRFPVTILTPSLAERREDIAQIARQILLGIAAARPNFEKNFVKHDADGWRHVPMHPSLMVGLLRHALPGNVRHMTKILEEAVEQVSAEAPALRWPRSRPEPPPAPLDVREEDRFVSARDLEEGLRRRSKETEPPPPDLGDALVDPDASPDPSRATVLQALRDNDWNYVATAKALGISVDKLYRLRIKYGIERPV